MATHKLEIAKTQYMLIAEMVGNWTIGYMKNKGYQKNDLIHLIARDEERNLTGEECIAKIMYVDSNIPPDMGNHPLPKNRVIIGVQLLEIINYLMLDEEGNPLKGHLPINADSTLDQVLSNEITIYKFQGGHCYKMIPVEDESKREANMPYHYNPDYDYSKVFYRPDWCLVTDLRESLRCQKMAYTHSFLNSQASQ
jgi:hypothetical protein